MKEKLGRKRIFGGQISDSSMLNSSTMDPLILGVESFFFDIAASERNFEQDTLFLNPPSDAVQYSILWLFVPSTYPQKIHPRLIYMNLWSRNVGCYTVQTAALADMAISCDMQTILKVNGWEIRALFLKSLLPVMAQGVILSHPKGIQLGWRAGVFLDVHLPLSEMLKLEATKKKPIFITESHQISSASSTPMAWVKQKEVDEKDPRSNAHRVVNYSKTGKAYLHLLTSHIFLGDV